MELEEVSVVLTPSSDFIQVNLGGGDPDAMHSKMTV